MSKNLKGSKKKINPERSKKLQQHNSQFTSYGDELDLENGPLEDRHCTDLFCLVLYIIANILFAYVIIESWSQGQPAKLFSVYDSSGYPCGQDDLETKPYIYFPIPHPDYLSYTTCVESCPSFENISAQPKSLNCNKNDSVQSCDLACDPLSLAQSSNIGWQISTDSLDYSTLFCIYDTETILDRICLPTEQLISAVPALSSKFEQYVDTDQFSGWFNDLTVAWPVIVGSIGVIFWLGIFYMLFIRMFSGIIVWLFILGYFVQLALMTVFFYLEYDLINQAITDCECEVDPNTKNNEYFYLFLTFLAGGIFILSLVGLYCLYDSIRLAIAIIKTATSYVNDTVEAMFVPPVFAIFTAMYWLLWLGGAVYVYSNGEFEKQSNNIFAKVTHTNEQSAKIWFYLFMGLWNNAFISSISQFILASAPCIWYFSQGSHMEAHRVVSKSVYRAFRYHLGSLAFGSFILAFVQMIRLILEYIYKKMQDTGADKNKLLECLMNCCRCLMSCFERFVRYMNKNAYIWISLTGKSFCPAARDAMKLLWNNPGRATLVSNLGTGFTFIGKMFMVLAAVYISYMVQIYVEPFKSDLTSAIFPCILVLVISYGIAMIFMSVYGMGVDAIFLCFLYDEQSAKAKDEDGKAKNCPQELQEFLQENIKINSRKNLRK